MSKTAKYEMRLSLSVLDDLGINLYSSVPAVLSEVIANAWDADAELVDIQLLGDRIVITDDGHGMNLEDINERYLHVGYRRRDEGRSTTPSGRPVMGRKGIGKLSLFAIAENIKVETVRGDDAHAFLLETSEIRRIIEESQGQEAYQPSPLPLDDIDFERGTRLTLTRLRRVADGRAGGGLKKRVARRFGVLGEQHDFTVQIDGEAVTVSDRGYWAQVEYLWVIGDTDAREHCSKVSNVATLSPVVSEHNGWAVTGWLGTVKAHGAIEDEAKIVPVLARGKLVHEDLLAQVKQGGLFTKYLVGELHAEFVDSDDDPDIATSDRQSLKESDYRFSALVCYLDIQLRHIADEWRKLRRQDAANEARNFHPAIKEWFESLEADTRAAAEGLFAKVGSVAVGGDDDRLELYKHAIVAFERLRVRELLSRVESLPEGDIDSLLPILGDIDEIEEVLYGQIAAGRLDVIRRFAAIVDDDEKEKIIQAYLFDHLWLLSPSWDRATRDEQMEKRVETALEADSESLSDGERAGRLDISYRNTGGAHVIIELKRYSVKVSAAELLAQMNKYRQAAKKVLQDNYPSEDHPVMEIAIVGERPSDMSWEEIEKTFGGIHAQIRTYDELISSSLREYEEYLDATSEVSRLAALLDRLEKPEDDAPS